AAVAALILFVAAVLAGVVGLVRSFPEGPVLVVLVAAAFLVGVDGLRRRGPARLVEIALAAAALVAAVVLAVIWRAGGAALVAAVLLLAAAAAGRRAFAARARRPAAPRPERPVVIWNPRSGGGKAARANLGEQAARRGIEAIELRPGDDLVALVEGAVAGGADALAAAGGDGTQALVATIAAREGLPFACIPAGTRNHFALDLGVDRNDVVGALDAFVDGSERIVDLAEVNGRVFVNNASLGVYAAAVQRDAYRDAKASTLLDTVPDAFGRGADSAPPLRWEGPDGRAGPAVAALLVSNNPYRLGTIVGSGTRPRMDGATLGVVAAGGRLRSWTTAEFVVDSDAPVPVGVDGEALVIDPPLVFRSRPQALRVRISRAHPGASPSSDAPVRARGAFAALVRIAAGRHGTS
ncbi:MAG: diacylglycerol kinase, partial [Actinobacteria bacterium]|nr:diacylglycerol kinase [Actinomycetota bacterium]